MIARVPAGAVLLSGADLETALYAIREAQQRRRSNGLSPSVQLQLLRDAMAEAGRPDVADGKAGESEPVFDNLTIAEAATLIGCSPRHARRLAPGLGGRRVGGQWLLDRLSVLEHVNGASAPTTT